MIKISLAVIAKVYKIAIPWLLLLLFVLLTQFVVSTFLGVEGMPGYRVGSEIIRNPNIFNPNSYIALFKPHFILAQVFIPFLIVTLVEFLLTLHHPSNLYRYIPAIIAITFVIVLFLFFSTGEISRNPTFIKYHRDPYYSYYHPYIVAGLALNVATVFIVFPIFVLMSLFLICRLIFKQITRRG